MDVKNIIEKKYISDNIINFSVSNDIFGDPMPNISKTLEIEIDEDGKIIKEIALEGEVFLYPLDIENCGDLY